jgi:uncharacterized protein
MEIPFVRLFKTVSYYYSYDINSNDIIRLDELLYDVLTMLTSGVDEEDITQVLEERYSAEQIQNALQTIKEVQGTGRLFSGNRTKELGYLCCDKAFEVYYDRYIEQITLEVTQRCNQRCRYCVYSGIYGNNRTHQQQDMSWETAKASIDYLLKHGGREANVYIDRSHDTRDIAFGFYGGEPLLRLDFLLQCTRYLREHLEPDRKCHITLTTNGTLLEPVVVKELLNHQITVVVSLDGPKHIHNRARIFPDGTGTHDCVLYGLENLQRYASELKPEIPLQGIINIVTIGDFDFVELWDYFTSLESLLNTPNLEYTVMANQMQGGLAFWNRQYPDDQMSHATGLEELTHAYEKACLDGIYKNDGKLDWRMRVLRDLMQKSFYFDLYGRTRYQAEGHYQIPHRFHPGSICLPGKRRPYVLADGTILPCERVPSNNPYFHIGKMPGQINVNEARRLLDNFTNATKEDCKNCWIQRMCCAGCVRDVVLKDKVDPDLKKENCTYARLRRYEELIGMCTLLEKDPTALDHYQKVTVS